MSIPWTIVHGPLPVGILSESIPWTIVHVPLSVGHTWRSIPWTIVHDPLSVGNSRQWIPWTIVHGPLSIWHSRRCIPWTTFYSLWSTFCWPYSRVNTMVHYLFVSQRSIPWTHGPLSVGHTPGSIPCTIVHGTLTFRWPYSAVDTIVHFPLRILGYTFSVGHSRRARPYGPHFVGQYLAFNTMDYNPWYTFHWP